MDNASTKPLTFPDIPHLSYTRIDDQTIGGIFLRKMTMISKEATKLTTLYSAGMSKLTDTSTDASTRKTDSGASVGFFSKARYASSVLASPMMMRLII